MNRQHRPRRGQGQHGVVHIAGDVNQPRPRLTRHEPEVVPDAAQSPADAGQANDVGPVHRLPGHSAPDTTEQFFDAVAGAGAAEEIGDAGDAH